MTCEGDVMQALSLVTPEQAWWPHEWSGQHGREEDY